MHLNYGSSGVWARTLFDQREDSGFEAEQVSGKSSDKVVDA